MGHLKCIMFVMVMIVISSSCCISKESMEKCKMKEVEFTVVSKNCYYINIVFSHYTSKQLRENLVKKLIVYKCKSIWENYITNISMKSKLNKSVGGKLIDLLIDKGYATMNGIAFIFQDKT